MLLKRLKLPDEDWAPSKEHEVVGKMTLSRAAQTRKIDAFADKWERQHGRGVMRRYDSRLVQHPKLVNSGALAPGGDKRLKRRERPDLFNENPRALTQAGRAAIDAGEVVATDTNPLTCVYQCTVCDIGLGGVQSYNTHIVGIKHKQKAQEKLEQVVSFSVFKNYLIKNCRKPVAALCIRSGRWVDR